MGIKISCGVKVKNNYKGINKVISKLPQAIKESLEDVLKNIQGCAIRLERGHNNDGILVEMIENSTMKVKGRIYTDRTNMPYALFEHFGTRTIC